MRTTGVCIFVLDKFYILWTWKTDALNINNVNNSFSIKTVLQKRAVVRDKQCITFGFQSLSFRKPDSEQPADEQCSFVPVRFVRHSKCTVTKVTSVRFNLAVVIATSQLIVSVLVFFFLFL